MAPSTERPADKPDTAARIRSTLASVAPGTALREGLERILRGRTGALIVVGHDRQIDSISTGGFVLDVPFTATGLRELAKMDGAIIIDKDASRILRAGVHLMPDPSIPTEESGTRHRTADRVARQTGVPVLSVSASMHIIALYLDDTRRVLEEAGAVLGRANQALATLERYKIRLDEVSDALSALEIEDLVTVRDVAAVAQRLEMVSRISSEIDTYVLELGTDGRLLSLQLEELISGVDAERELVIRDYMPGGRRKRPVETVLAELSRIDSSDLVDLGAVTAAMRIGSDGSLDTGLSPRGYRLLARVPRMPAAVVERLIEHFGSLQKLLAASIDDLQAVEGVGDLRAHGVREGLSRLAESSILERYV
ncbi:MAG: DNA integrity scanning protein DisA [Kineosporiaceae bacterium]|nr:DNA integrity scanning protein DisA [Aeromicrobium sp.]